MDDADHSVQDEAQGRIPQDGNVCCESQNKCKDLPANVHGQIFNEKSFNEENVCENHFDSPCASEKDTPTTNSKISSQSCGSIEHRNNILVTGPNSLTLMPSHKACVLSVVESTNSIPEKYLPYHMQHDQRPTLASASQSDMSSVESELSKDVSEQMPKAMLGQLNVTTAEAPEQMYDVPKSLSGMEVLYNTARNTFETEPQRIISSMDVLYTAATVSQLDSASQQCVGSSVATTVPGINTFYRTTPQSMPSEIPSSVSTTTVSHNTNDRALCDMLPSHQSPQDTRITLTSVVAEYNISEAPLHNKQPNNSFDSSAYEKYKHLVTQIDGPPSSSPVFPLSSSTILSSPETHASTTSSYYSPHTALSSGTDTGSGDRDGKQIDGMVGHNSHLSYYTSGPVRDIPGEHHTNSLCPDSASCHSDKDYNRVPVSLPSMNVIRFMTGYDIYRSKVLAEEHQLQGFGEYHHSVNNNSQQQKSSVVSETGPVHYGYNIQNEKTSSTNLMHVPEVHTRFSFHENGQIGLTNLFDSRKLPQPQLPEFVPRESSPTQQPFYPKLPSRDSSIMYARSDMQKYHHQAYQDLEQRNHVAHYQSASKTNLEQFPASQTFGFHQSNHCNSASELQNICNEKNSFSRLESLEKSPSTNSSQAVHEPSSDGLHKSDDLAKGERQARVSSSEHEALYCGPPPAIQSVQHTESSMLRHHLEHPVTPSGHGLEANSYRFALQSQQKELNTAESSVSPRSDMSAIKMKINAILESTSLQFDDTAQNELNRNNDDSKSNNLANQNLKEDNSLNDKTSNDNELKSAKCVPDILVPCSTNDELKNIAEPLVKHSEGAKKADKRVSTNATYKKNRSKYLKGSINNKMKKDSGFVNKLNVDSNDEMLTTSISLKIDEAVFKEDIPVPQYKCDLCQKEFSQLCSFQRHVRFHNGQALFTCDLCGLGFNDLFSFVDHITEVGSEKLAQLKTIPDLITINQKPLSLTKSEFTKSKKFTKRKFRRSKRLKKNINIRSKVLKGSIKKDEPEAVGGDDDSSAMENEVLDNESVDMEHDVKTEDCDELQMKNFKCNECGMQFNYARYLSAHLLTHSDQKSFQCEICSKEFSHGHSLNRHRKKAHPKIVIHSCNICGEGFNRFPDLKKHARCHLADNSLKCKMCEQEFSCQRDLQLHVSSHTGGKAFQCDLCWKQFTQYCTLLRHKRRFDHSGGPPYKCKWCGEGFYEMGKLLSHSRKHMGSGPHKCDVCGKGFATTNNLKVHKSSVHSSEKPFCCDQCGDQFTRVSYLRQHIKTHKGDRPYVCELCGKGFGMQDTLSKHMRTHTGEKPYSCDQCGKQFSLTATLTVHKRTHTGERPYVCDVCGKGFIDNSSWNKHIKHHHKSINDKSTPGVREGNMNNYKTFDETGSTIDVSCLSKNRMGDLIKGRELHVDGQFLTSQMTQ